MAAIIFRVSTSPISHIFHLFSTRSSKYNAKTNKKEVCEIEKTNFKVKPNSLKSTSTISD